MSSNRSSPGDTKVPTIAVIGCGAIADASHIPALARHASIRDRLVLVDRDGARAEAAAARHGVTRTSDDYRSVLGEVDGVVISVPHHLHVPISLDCLSRSVHVLCEKPLADTTAEVERLVEAAETAGVTIGVNNKRRLFSSSRIVKELIDAGTVGELKSFEYYQGAKFDWPATTDSYFGAKGSGKGVLFDLGSHVLDLACWWLGGRPELVSYEDDSRGGTEAVARVVFRHGQCRGLVHLSWLTRLRNSYRIVGSRGSIEGELYDERGVTLVQADGRRVEKKGKVKVDTAQEMMDSFIATITTGTAPAVPAREVSPSIGLIDECYVTRGLLAAPWYVDATRGANA
jgi:predicted dehydrogenase